MKRIFLSSLVALLLFSSCEKDLDQVPISSATTETFYTSTNDFLQSTNAVYNNLRGYPDRQLNLSETRSDNLYAISEGGVRDWDPINGFQKTLASNPYITEAWSSNFNGIYKANVLLDQLKTNGNVVTETNLRTRFEAEARFLRAFYYFDLVRWFGRVPLLDHPLTANEALNAGRNPVSEIYDLIIADLQFAAENLPESFAGADLGRATKYAAKAWLALVYMTRSGPTYNIEGPGLASNEWTKAQALLNDVIASNKYGLVTPYSSIFSFTNENNREVVFDVQYMTGVNPVLGGTFAWLLTPDTYFQSQGKPIQGGLQIRPISNSLLNSYEGGDVRRNVTIHGGYVYNGVPETRSFYQKYVDLTKVPSNRLDWPINFMVMRYTDAILLRAECILHGAPGTQADVDAIVNQVRQRAGLAPVSNVNLAQLMEERRKEFAGEGLRWHDLVRSGLVESVMTAWIASEDVQHQIQPFQKNYIIYPVPQSELDVKQGLYTQNAGY